jgi:hypothetical protein
MRLLRQSITRRAWIVPRSWEDLAAFLFLIAAFVCAWPEARAMATSSLWQDELHSVSHYSAKGPLVTMTTYGEPNNHIFFNMLNSLVPGKHRFEPERARFLSYVFLILTVLVMLIYQARHDRLLEGSFQVFLFVANIANLDLVLQARGYGLLALAAIIATVLTQEYFRKPSFAALVGIPIVIWLATWAVPTFLFFGAPLLIVLLIYTRDWRWLLAGLCALIAICLVYWPVHGEILRNAKTYASQWGKDFATWGAVSDVLSEYLLFGAASWVTFLVTSGVTIALLLRPIQNAQEKTSLCVGLAILFTFVVCLKMGTPIKRTVAFTVVPFAFIMTTLLSRFTRSSLPRSVRLGVIAAMTTVILLFTFHIRRTFQFTPIESWLETAHTIEHRFPRGTEIVARFRPQWLSVYLSKDYSLTREFEPGKFLAGKQIVLDSSFKREERFPITKLPTGYAKITVPQRRGQSQKIYFWAQSPQP